MMYVIDCIRLCGFVGAHAYNCCVFVQWPEGDITTRLLLVWIFTLRVSRCFDLFSSFHIVDHIVVLQGRVLPASNAASSALRGSWSVGRTLSFL